MKRIVFTVTNDLTYDQRMQRICRSLSNAGYEVELIGRERNFSIPLQNEPYRQTRLSCFFDKGKLFYIEYNLRLLFYLTFSNYDAACAIDLDTVVPVYLIGKLKGAKLVYDAHEYFTEVPEVVRRPSVKKVWEWVEKTFIPKFDLIYTVSPGLAELFQKKYNKKVEVIMNVPFKQETALRGGVLPPRESVRRTPYGEGAGSYILYQGALNEGRGLEHLLEAMQQLPFPVGADPRVCPEPESHPHIDCKLKLAGEGDLSDELRRMAKQLNLTEKVEFLGYVDPGKLKEITAGAGIGIQLLEHKGLSYYYSLSNKFFDYIHAGVPQVCIDFPEYRNINNQYEVALLVKDCSADEIKAAILRLIGDKAFYAKLQINCDVCSRVLNWQNEEKKLFSLYGYLFR